MILFSFVTTAHLHAQEITIKRTFSTFPALDLLKIAIKTNQLDVIEENDFLLPHSIDCQYAFFGLATTRATKQILISKFEKTWHDRIEHDASESINMLLFELHHLKRMCTFERLEDDFRNFLTALFYNHLVKQALPREETEEWVDLVALASEPLLPKQPLQNSLPPVIRVIAFPLAS